MDILLKLAYCLTVNSLGNSFHKFILGCVKLCSLLTFRFKNKFPLGLKWWALVLMFPDLENNCCIRFLLLCKTLPTNLWLKPTHSCFVCFWRSQVPSGFSVWGPGRLRFRCWLRCFSPGGLGWRRLSFRVVPRLQSSRRLQLQGQQQRQRRCCFESLPSGKAHTFLWRAPLNCAYSTPPHRVYLCGCAFVSF